jgi:hypothetical protein
MANRFTTRDNNKETLTPDISSMLLNILRAEFPEDPLYAQGILSPGTATLSSNGKVPPVNNKQLSLVTRNDYNIIQSKSGSSDYVEYDINKSYPTINDRDLDDLIDEEWDFFTRVNAARPIPPTGLFLINTEIELNPVDFHDAYLQRGPSTIAERLADGESEEQIIQNTFCVYYIEGGVALPIPNYQTLEVMLVERGKTYSDISEATADQVAQFDMSLDGVFLGDRTDEKPNPIEEFEFRKVLNRSTEWNYQVRFESGYRPKAPFYRDPGDYLKPSNYIGTTGTSDLYIDEDPRDLYFDQVFQKQTYREKLRTKYEGKMVILDWPIPYNDSLVNSSTNNVQSDDLVLGLRMMINGFWKQITDEAVARTFAALNNFSLAEYQLGQGRYGEFGWLNLLIQAGAIEVLKNDGLGSPIWNDFPHIVEADRLDIDEYRAYIDNYSNSSDPFNIEYLKPYEPEGSIAYYPSTRLDALRLQAAAQAEVDSIKEDIKEYWPQIAAQVANLVIILQGQPASYVDEYVGKLGKPAAVPTNNDLKGPLYSILTSVDGFKYVKRKPSGLKEKDTRTNLLELFERNERISGGAFNNPYDANRIMGGSGNPCGVVHALGTNQFPIGNVGNGQLPRRSTGDSNRLNVLMNDPLYIKRMVRAAVIQYLNKDSYWKGSNTITQFATTDPLYEDAVEADNLIGKLKSDIILANDFLLEIDDLLLEADSLEAFQDIYNRILALKSDLDSFNNEGLVLCNNTRTNINSTFKLFLERLYNSVQYFRQRVHDEIGNKSKFGVEWPPSARAIIEQYLPGKSFDNYLPTQE